MKLKTLSKLKCTSDKYPFLTYPYSSEKYPLENATAQIEKCDSMLEAQNAIAAEKLAHIAALPPANATTVAARLELLKDAAIDAQGSRKLVEQTVNALLSYSALLDEITDESELAAASQSVVEAIATTFHKGNLQTATRSIISKAERKSLWTNMSAEFETLTELVAFSGLKTKALTSWSRRLTAAIADGEDRLLPVMKHWSSAAVDVRVTNATSSAIGGAKFAGNSTRGDAQFDFPVSIAAVLPSEASILVAHTSSTIWSQEDFEAENKDMQFASAVHGLSIFNPDESKVSVSGLVEPILVRIPLEWPTATGAPIPRSIAQCRYWDAGEGIWSASGCKVIELTTSSVTCACTHLTEFAVIISPEAASTESPEVVSVSAQSSGGYEDPQSEPASTLFGISYFVLGGGGLGLILFFGFSVIVCLRRRNINRKQKEAAVPNEAQISSDFEEDGVSLGITGKNFDVCRDAQENPMWNADRQSKSHRAHSAQRKSHSNISSVVAGGLKNKKVGRRPTVEVHSTDEIVKLFDETHQKHYYVNKTTGQSGWQREEVVTARTTRTNSTNM
jgi:hypothetical protein